MAHEPTAQPEQPSLAVRPWRVARVNVSFTVRFTCMTGKTSRGNPRSCLEPALVINLVVSMAGEAYDFGIAAVVTNLRGWFGKKKSCRRAGPPAFVGLAEPLTGGTIRAIQR